MAILKCKMCGGDIEISADKTYGTCDSCGSTMTFPKATDEQRANLFNRANHFRRQNEFDKAISAYERILDQDNTDAEAHWGVVLSRFGIEYVEDPISRERIPTCHRVQTASILTDADYLAAKEYAADSYSATLYEQEAKRIAEIQRDILAISMREEPYDVFICYKETTDGGTRTRDSILAQDIYYQLTNEGKKVFFSRITLEDKLGQQYEPYIFAALNSAKVMLVVGTKSEYFNAVWVKNEWSRYLALMKSDRSRLLIPCYRDIDPYDLPEELSALQSLDMGKIGFMQDLLHGIQKVLTVEEKPAPAVAVASTESAPGVSSLLRRAQLFLEDGDWDSANEYCEKVLDIDPENVQAYLCNLLSDLRVRKLESLKDYAEPFASNKNYIRLIRFADVGMKKEMEEVVAFVKNRNTAITYDKATILLRSAGTEAEVDEAVELLRTCADYKDSTELIASAKEEFVQKRTEFEELLSRYYELSSRREKIPARVMELKQELKPLRDSKRQLEALQQIYPEINTKISEAEAEINRINATLESLLQEHMRLGFFSGKRKQAIELEMTVNKGRVRSLKEAIVEYKNKVLGCTSIEQLKAKIEGLETKISANMSEELRLREAMPAYNSIDNIIAKLLTETSNHFTELMDLKLPGKFAIMKCSKLMPMKCKACGSDLSYTEGITCKCEVCGSVNKLSALDRQTAVREIVDSQAESQIAELLHRVFGFLEKFEWTNADECCEKVLAIDPENAQAYLGLLMSNLHVWRQDLLRIQFAPFDSNIYYIMAIRFADADLKKELEEANAFINNQKNVLTYNKATDLLRSAGTEAEVDEAIELLRTCSDYKDSAELIASAKEEFARKRTEFEELLSRYYKLSSQNLGSHDIESVKAELLSGANIHFPETKELGLPLKLRLMKCKVGDVVFFGAYRQRINKGKEDVMWQVLAKEDNKLLLLSKYALDLQVYNEKRDEKANWETCSLRTWLNKSFINDAFSSEERAMIAITTISANENPMCATNPGDTTLDKVFLLSAMEADKYFNTDEARMCIPTELTMLNSIISALSKCGVSWSLRTPGKVRDYSVATVNILGRMAEIPAFYSLGVRPAIWVDLDSTAFTP